VPDIDDSSKFKLFQLLHQSYINNFGNVFPEKILVAVSGGIDSLALVLIANHWCSENNILLKTVTIDHQLRSDSTLEASKVHDIMEKHNIDHEVVTWNRKGEVVSNIEASARQARYDLLTNYANINNISIIITAHHLDDQVETFFMRLVRGSGIDGLSAMKMKTNITEKIVLFRPFLEIEKKYLKQYLEDQDQEWFEDSTNKNTDFLRNKIRKMLYEIEDKKIIDKRIIRTIEHFGRAKDFLESHTEAVFSDLVTNKEGRLVLDRLAFNGLHEEIALRLLIRIFKEVGGQHNKPRFNNLFILYQNLTSNKIKKRTTFSHALITLKENLIIFQQEERISR